MDHTMLLRAILPDVLIDNFDVASFEKTEFRFDIYLDEKKFMTREDKNKRSAISYGFGEYRAIQDFPIRGRATYLHVRKRKWLDKDTGEIFSYGWDLSEFDETRLNAEFVAFLKVHDPRCGNETQRTDAFAACRKREVTIFNGNAYLCCRQARKSDF